MSIKVLTDSTSYIPKEFLDKYDITIISLNIALGGKNVKEINLENKDFYKMMYEYNEFPKSSQPIFGEVEEVFNRILSEGNDIIGIFISSDMSGTYFSANVIKEMMNEKYLERKIHIIDSRSNCMQMGFAVIEAAKSAKAGKNFEEVIDSCKDIMSKSGFLFIPDTLDYLKMVGRIGSALVGNILKINSLLTVNNGKTDVVEKVRTKRREIDKILNLFLEDTNEKGIGDVIVHHINCEEEGNEIANRIKKI
ncbi:DegV family protein [Clostridium septicum]|uniref:DegV family protein n=1 Tax=Clostridium septicum TaxID=1504 RepID=A0ABY5B4N9_CLOSE|nr:DegV family protein [Clostridium septicum]MDU1313181.1 DegV family protein [Clostridium septicum]USS02191.1 DegV family protein [Clostridium septicum]